ncbi:MAG: RNA polymerase sigma factor [Luteibaculaceae bacterium]
MEHQKAELQLLLSQCVAGNTKAQFSLYQRFAKTMYRSAYQFLQQEALAQDAMQEAFLKAFTKLETFKNEVPFEAWLRKIVINEALQVLRKDKPNLFTAVEEFPEEAGYQATEGDSTTDEENEKVLQAIGKLKTSYSTIIQLHYIEGYDYEEISLILNISYANCRTLMHRAKEQLREKLNESK